MLNWGTGRMRGPPEIGVGTVRVVSMKRRYVVILTGVHCAFHTIQAGREIAFGRGIGVAAGPFPVGTSRVKSTADEVPLPGSFSVGSSRTGLASFPAPCPPAVISGKAWFSVSLPPVLRIRRVPERFGRALRSSGHGGPS